MIPKYYTHTPNQRSNVNSANVAEWNYYMVV